MGDGSRSVPAELAPQRRQKLGRAHARDGNSIRAREASQRPQCLGQPNERGVDIQPAPCGGRRRLACREPGLELNRLHLEPALIAPGLGIRAGVWVSVEQPRDGERSFPAATGSELSRGRRQPADVRRDLLDRLPAILVGADVVPLERGRFTFLTSTKLDERTYMQ